MVRVSGPGVESTPTTTSVKVVETRMGKKETKYYQVPTRQLVKE